MGQIEQTVCKTNEWYYIVVGRKQYLKSFNCVQKKLGLI